MDRGVFINYRGADSHSYGALLFTELARRFGEERVFLDCESVPAGADFVQELLARVRSAKVLLAVIGPHWLTATDPTGRRWIDDPDDWTRRELSEAFTAGVRVIPVLTDHAELPAAAELPADIVALSRCQYRRLRYREPTADLARIVTDLISLDPTLAATARGRDDAPHQLPAAPGTFVGRVAELATLTDAANDAGTTVVISALAGAGGIGKTALAMQWAHQHLHRFPDGQLYVNLRGFDPSGHPYPAGAAIRDFLDALGADTDTLPVDLDAQAARYRSLVAGRRMLIVLDNAATADQVTSLLPGASTCTVIVTSRTTLTSLITRYGARHVPLTILDVSEAHALLAQRLGEARLAAEPDATTELVQLCGRYPLALTLIAARAHAHPRIPLAEFVTELCESGVHALDDADPTASLPAVLSWSLHNLTPQQRMAFALLGAVPGPDISLPAVANLTALPPHRARTVLRDLEEASLLDRQVGDRYAMHDLIRDYAATTVHPDLTEDVQEAALRRALDFYTHTAHTANQILDPHHPPVRLTPPAPGTYPHALSGAAAAMSWFDVEHRNLLAVLHTAVSHDWYDTVWQLAWSLSTFHFRRGRFHDELAVWRAGLDAADHLPDPTTRILAHRLLGRAYVPLDRQEVALGHLDQALALAERHHDPTQQAHTHQQLAWAWARQGHDQRALDHATRALDLFRTLDNPIWEARALSATGWFAARLGDYDVARAHCQTALAMHRQHHHREGEASTLDSLGYIAHQLGQHDQAVQHYQQALTLYRRLSHTSYRASTLDRLGHPLAALGRYDQARASWWEALDLYRKQGRDNDVSRVQRQLDDLDDRTS